MGDGHYGTEKLLQCRGKRNRNSGTNDDFIHDFSTIHILETEDFKLKGRATERRVLRLRGV